MRYKVFFLMAGDIILGVAALFTGFITRFGYVDGTTEFATKFLARLVLFLFVIIVMSYIFEVYKTAMKHNRIAISAKILIAVCMSFAILSMCYYIFPQLIIGRGLLALSLAFFVLYQFLWHLLFLEICNKFVPAKNVLILGTCASAQTVGNFLQSPHNSGSNVFVGYVADAVENQKIEVPENLIIGKLKDLAEIAVRKKILQIVVMRQERRGQSEQQNILLNCKLHGVEILDAPTFLEPLTGKIMLEYLDVNRLIYSEGFIHVPMYVAIKKLFDLSLSLIGIILLLPFFPFIALSVKLDSPGPIFFRQMRIGQWGKIFVLYKFRTMCQNAERDTGAVWSQENDLRITPTGCFLRKYRLDEIPQLFNVIKGDMSLIGPRPERPEFEEVLDRQIPLYSKRHFIKPGITGWAQIKYAYGCSIKDAYEKMQYDLYYFKHMSCIMDITIILKTFRVVVFGKGR